VVASKGTCATVVSDDNICTVVHGSVTLFINKQSSGDLAFARYAARSTIEESMSEGFYKSPVVEGIEMVTYRGPLFTIPVFEDDDGNMINEFSQTNVDSSVTEPSGMTRMEIVVVATLVSAVIGIAGAMLLSKRVLIPGQNCLAACDGTGIDVKYMNDIKKDGHGHAGAANCTGSSTGNSIIDEASEMQWNSNTGLSVIEESSDAPSYFTRDSYATSSTPFSRRTGGSDDNSVHSEKTFKISNKFRTPSFGNDVIREVSCYKYSYLRSSKPGLDWEYCISTVPLYQVTNETCSFGWFNILGWSRFAAWIIDEWYVCRLITMYATGTRYASIRKKA
jgi:hypothetical protein